MTTRKPASSKAKTPAKAKSRAQTSSKSVSQSRSKTPVSKWNAEAAELKAIRLSQAVIEFGMDGVIIDANTAFLTTMGYTLDEIKGRHHSLFVDFAYANSLEYREFWAALNRGDHKTGEMRRLAKGGAEVWLQASYFPVLDKAGRPCSVLKIASDVTAAKNQSADMQGQVAAASN